MSGDVLCRDSAGALGKRFLVAGLLLVGEFALGVSKEMGAVAIQNEQLTAARRSCGANQPGPQRGGRLPMLLRLSGARCYLNTSVEGWIFRHSGNFSLREADVSFAVCE